MKMKREKDDHALFNRIAYHYARKDIIRSSLIPRKSLLLEAIHPLLNQLDSLGTVLDIGCGAGAPAKYLRGYYQEYIGIDQSEKMVEAARLFNKDIPHTRFLTGNIKTIDLPSHTIDIILSIGALHHMTDLDMVMKAVCRLAKPNGFILVIEPQNANPLIQMMRRIRTWLDHSYSSDQLFFSRDELVFLFERNNIKNIFCDYMGYLSTPFAEVVLRPQFLFVPLSRIFTSVDSWFYRRLPEWVRKFSFKVVIRGQFDLN